MNLKFDAKINGWAVICAVIGVLVLCFLLFRGCKQSRIEVAEKEKAIKLADSALAIVANYSSLTDSIIRDFNDSLELERGQKELAIAQKERTENELDRALNENKELIAQHKLAKYADTSAVVVPNGYVTECEDCFTKLDNTTKLSLRYKNDLNNLQDNWDKQNALYQKQFKSQADERLKFLTQIQSLSKEAKTAANKLEPHGKLYLSWGVMFGPWPKMAGGGLMYQTKYNMMYEANWFYGNQGHMVEASLKFPLSIKF